MFGGAQMPPKKSGGEERNPADINVGETYLSCSSAEMTWQTFKRMQRLPIPLNIVLVSLCGQTCCQIFAVLEGRVAPRRSALCGPQMSRMTLTEQLRTGKSAGGWIT